MSRRDDHHRSRALIQDSRACIASAHEVVDQAQRPMARQQYLKVVCAWCTRTIRWQRREGSVPGEVSHGICRACAAVVFRELHARQPRADSGGAFTVFPPAQALCPTRSAALRHCSLCPMSAGISCPSWPWCAGRRKEKQAP
jgi:hypothetical protein